MSPLLDHGPSMSALEFRLIRDLVNERAGLAFGDEATFVLERRLRERLSALAIDSFSDYQRLLRYDDAELERALELLTTHETYFYREAYQLEAFEAQLVPELAKRNAARKRLTIWSAGCSTGEEVYTIAMILAESRRFDGWEVRVFGSDISRRVLQTARRGVYRDASFRAMPARFERYFVDARGGGREVRTEIRAMCHFGQLNLLDRGRTTLMGGVDVIFCRNVLIYFDPASRARVVRTFYERLMPGGYLLLGHSESLLRSSTDFELVHLRTDMVYRRPAPLAGTAR